MKLVTPRGGRDFHGSVFEFHRNDALDANTFFNNRSGLPVPKLIQNQYGFNLSGPFRLPRFGEGGPSTWGKDKLFFYVYDEETKARSEGSVNRTTLNAASRTGLFTYRRADNSQLQTINLLTATGRTSDARMTNYLD